MRMAGRLTVIGAIVMAVSAGPVQGAPIELTASGVIGPPTPFQSPRFRSGDTWRIRLVFDPELMVDSNPSPSRGTYAGALTFAFSSGDYLVGNGDVPAEDRRVTVINDEGVPTSRLDALVFSATTRALNRFFLSAADVNRQVGTPGPLSSDALPSTPQEYGAVFQGSNLSPILQVNDPPGPTGISPIVLRTPPLSFYFRYVPPAELATILIERSMGAGPGKALIGKARDIMEEIEEGDSREACSELAEYRDFLAVRADRDVTVDLASELDLAAAYVASALRCGSLPAER